MASIAPAGSGRQKRNVASMASSDAIDQGGEVAQSVDRDSARMDEHASRLVLNGVNWPCGLWQTKTECGKHERSASAPGFLRRCLDQEERKLPRLAIGGGQGSGRHWDGAVWEAQGLAEARWTSKDNAAAGAAQSRSQRNLPVSALVMARSTFRSPVVRRVRTRLPVLGSTARSFFFVLRPFFAMIRVPVLTGQAFPKSHARAPRDLYRRFLGLLNLAERDRGIPVS